MILPFLRHLIGKNCLIVGGPTIRLSITWTYYILAFQIFDLQVNYLSQVKYVNATYNRLN